MPGSRSPRARDSRSQDPPPISQVVARRGPQGGDIQGPQEPATPVLGARKMHAMRGRPEIAERHGAGHLARCIARAPHPHGRRPSLTRPYPTLPKPSTTSTTTLNEPIQVILRQQRITSFEMIQLNSLNLRVCCSIKAVRWLSGSHRNMLQGV